MEEKQVMLIVLVTNDILISDVRQVVSELGEPDCRLINPFIVKEKTNIVDQTTIELKPWLNDYTLDCEIMISSDKILTLVEPKGYLLDEYLEKTK